MSDVKISQLYDIDDTPIFPPSTAEAIQREDGSETVEDSIKKINENLSNLSTPFVDTENVVISETAIGTSYTWVATEDVLFVINDQNSGTHYWSMYLNGVCLAHTNSSGSFVIRSYTRQYVKKGQTINITCNYANILYVYAYGLIKATE